MIVYKDCARYYTEEGLINTFVRTLKHVLGGNVMIALGEFDFVSLFFTFSEHLVMN